MKWSVIEAVACSLYKELFGRELKPIEGGYPNVLYYDIVKIFKYVDHLSVDEAKQSVNVIPSSVSAKVYRCSFMKTEHLGCIRLVNLIAYSSDLGIASPKRVGTVQPNTDAWIENNHDSYVFSAYNNDVIKFLYLYRALQMRAQNENS